MSNPITQSFNRIQGQVNAFQTITPSTDVHTPFGHIHVPKGSWIVTEVDGSNHPFSDATFKKIFTLSPIATTTPVNPPAAVPNEVKK